MSAELLDILRDIERITQQAPRRASDADIEEWIAFRSWVCGLLARALRSAA